MCFRLMACKFVSFHFSISFYFISKNNFYIAPLLADFGELGDFHFIFFHFISFAIVGKQYGALSYMCFRLMACKFVSFHFSISFYFISKNNFYIAPLLADFGELGDFHFIFFHFISFFPNHMILEI